MKKPPQKKAPRIPLALRSIRFIYNTLGRLFPSYYGHRAYELWFTTTRFKTPVYEQQAEQSAIKETINVNGLPIAVYIWPAEKEPYNKTLLFIHGWTGRGTQVVNYIKPLNATGYRIISFDGPAHGHSPGKQTSAIEMADVILAMNKHYGPFDAAITHSFGGMILAYAMSLGLNLKRAALICPPKDFQVLLDNFQRILTLPDSVMQVLVRKSFATHGQNIRDALHTVNNLKRSNSKGLVIHDEDDMDISWHSGKEIADAWPQARFIKTRGLGHRRIIHDAAVINSIVEFLNEED